MGSVGPEKEAEGFLDSQAHQLRSGSEISAFVKVAGWAGWAGVLSCQLNLDMFERVKQTTLSIGWFHEAKRGIRFWHMPAREGILDSCRRSWRSTTEA